MNLKNALKLTFTHNNLVMKSILYRLVLYAFYFLCSYLILNSFLISLFSHDCFSTLIITLWKYIKLFIQGKGFKNAMLDKHFSDCVHALFTTSGNYIGSLIGFGLFNIVFETVNNFADTAIVSVVNNHMSYLSREGFFGSLVRNFKRALTYGFFFAIYKLLFVLLSLVALIFIFIGMFKIIGFFALPLAIVVYVLIVAIRQTIISQILPFMTVNNCGLFKAIKSVKFNKQFSGIYLSYIFGYSLTIFFNFTALICTLGAGVLLTLPLTYLLIDTLGLTSYYEINKMKYYITYDLKYIPRELRENGENLLNDMII